MSFGKFSIVRAAAAGLFLITFASIKTGGPAWSLAAVAGGVICASFAWMGHGAATPGLAGLLHAASDILHPGRRLVDRRARGLPDPAPH